MDRTFHAYLMASQSGVLYLCVTGNLAKRVCQHKEKLIPLFTKKYNVTELVWFETDRKSPALRNTNQGLGTYNFLLMHGGA
jgi:predicted GIY-YIG superfamily endonuclease